MTDNDIVKALEDAIKIGDAPIGKYWGCMISKLTAKEAVDLINRQKAEIERLKRKLVAYEPSVDSGLFSQMLLEQKEKAEAFEKKWKAEIKAEAYREFAERVKSLNQNNLILWNEQIDNILKELVGEDDG